ncbi:AAA family ATPase [Hyphomonas sp. FCG-A18]|uniref:AAA family ATPase n=1 Tax=Hyphomonas sp. FCG-A18 TaxID=3080019 RepID=UPI002B2CD0A9|nr:AAA family ATPase [Hyphomonas sp. FCG-A18]
MTTRLIFVYGPPAAGKYTVSRLLSEQTGLPLFHNHLIVDAVGAVFPFGSENFAKLRERFWLETMNAALGEGRSLIFTFQPENTVAEGFPAKVEAIAERHGASLTYIHLTLSKEGQLERIANADRAKFGKLRDLGILRANLDQFAACEAAMPPPALTIDTASTAPEDAANQIAALLV